MPFQPQQRVRALLLLLTVMFASKHWKASPLREDFLVAYAWALSTFFLKQFWRKWCFDIVTPQETKSDLGHACGRFSSNSLFKNKLSVSYLVRESNLRCMEAFRGTDAEPTCLHNASSHVRILKRLFNFIFELLIVTEHNFIVAQRCLWPKRTGWQIAH